MKDPTSLHDHAMSLADTGDSARRRGDHELSKAAFEEAVALDRQAAELELSEPSRSILFRSAAWLALEAENAAEAERLAACGLSSRAVPERIKLELRAVAEEARLRLHRPLPPPSAASSISLHIEGPEIGFGGADPADIDPRVSAMRYAVIRTAERKASSPFRRRSAPAAALMRQLQPRLTYASASVEVQITLGGSQPNLWDENAAIVREVRLALEAFANGGEDSLASLIPEVDYRRNFALLAAQICPDGRRVTAVDIRSTTATESLPIVRFRQRTPRPRHRRKDGNSEVILEGELRAADETGRSNSIKLQTSEAVFSIRVKDVVMEDIVRPFYGMRVRVVVRKRSRGYELLDLPEPA